MLQELIMGYMILLIDLLIRLKTIGSSFAMGKHSRDQIQKCIYLKIQNVFFNANFCILYYYIKIYEFTYHSGEAISLINNPTYNHIISGIQVAE